MKLFAGSSNKELFEEIAKILGQRLGKLELKKFSDGESIAILKEDVEGENCVLMQSTCNAVNENLMELLIMGNAALSNGAKEVHAIIPYYGYARQDRVVEPGEPITTKLVVDLLEAAGFASITTMDVHSHATIDYCKVPCNNLFFFPVLEKYLEDKAENRVVVAPDGGALDNNSKYADAMETDLYCIKKERSAAEKIKKMEIDGEVKGKNVLMVDDLIGTGRTLVKAAELLKKEGAKDIIVAATHGVFCGDALKNFENSEISEVIVSNTIPQDSKVKKLTVLSIAKEFAKFLEKIR